MLFEDKEQLPADTIAKHVSPETETERPLLRFVSRWKLLGHQLGLVARPARVARVDVGKGPGDPVRGKARVVPLRSGVGVLTATADLPFKVGRGVVCKLAEARVKGAVAFALVTPSELDLVDCNVAAVPSYLGRLSHWDRLHDDGVLLGVGVHHLGFTPRFAGGVHQGCQHNITGEENILPKIKYEINAFL